MSPKLEALGAAFFEVTAGGASDVVDAALVGVGVGSEMDASAVGSSCETDHAEVTGLYGLRNVISSNSSPAREVLGRNQNAPVGSGAAARATRQAVQLFTHRCHYGSTRALRIRWTCATMRDLVRSIVRFGLVLLLVGLLGCRKSEPSGMVVLPKVPPDTVVLSWSVISRSTTRDSVHAVLEASRKLTTTKRSADGTMISASRSVSKREYSDIVASLRSLDCCALQSTAADRVDPAEAKPLLEINLGDVQCEIELWDREWRQGRARECAFAAAQIHRAGSVPDPAVDDSPR